MDALLSVESIRIAVAILGISTLIIAIRYFIKKHLHASLPVLLGLFALAITLLACACFPNLYSIFQTHTRIGRIRLGVITITLSIIVVTFESIRRTSLKERYALLWVIPCFLILFLTAQPRIMDFIRDSFGMEYPSIMVAIVFLTVLTSVFVLSKSISKNERNITSVAQRCAMLEARIKDLEKNRHL